MRRLSSRASPRPAARQRKRREKAKAKAAAASTLGARDPEPTDEDAALDALSDSAVLLTTLPPLPENADSPALYRALIATVDANASCLKQYVARLSARKLAPSATPTPAKSRIVAGLEFPPSPVPFPFTPQRPVAQGAVPAQLASEPVLPARLAEDATAVCQANADLYVLHTDRLAKSGMHVDQSCRSITKIVSQASADMFRAQCSANLDLIDKAYPDAPSPHPSSFQTPRRG